MGDGGAEGSSATGDGGQTAISLMPDVDTMHVWIFENSQPESLYVGDLLYVSGAQEPMSVLWILVAPNTCAS